MAYSQMLAWRWWLPKEVRPLPLRLKVCLEKAEEREGIERGGQSSHSVSLAQAGPHGRWSALTERQFHPPPVPCWSSKANSVLSPRNALPGWA